MELGNVMDESYNVDGGTPDTKNDDGRRGDGWEILYR